MNRRNSLWSALSSSGKPSERFIRGRGAGIALCDLERGSVLDGRSEELAGRSVLLATEDQFHAALALIELDGIASRIVLCPSGLSPQHLAFVMDAAQVEAIVSDRSKPGPDTPGVECFVTCSTEVVPAKCDRRVAHQTEWVLLTSGTTGFPKLVAHTLSSLAGAIKSGSVAANPPVWSTFYDIRRYGGLQIFLRAVLSGASLVLSSAEEPTATFLKRAGSHGVTHISGTPSHWRRAIMSPSASSIAPQYVRLSGEIADQSILDHLRSFYPQARVAHAFASTEAGLVFEVNDGLAGFPAAFIGQTGDVDMKIHEGSLRVRSSRMATSYIGPDAKTLRDADGFIDTTDMLERRGDRYYFVGRRDGVINVGGLKVHPEEVEAVINGHPQVRMSLVRTRKNPITGALVVADVVVEKNSASEAIGKLQREILQICRDALPRHKVPAAINVVPELTVAPAGKMARHHA